jgi:hypothetical protein
LGTWFPGLFRGRIVGTLNSSAGAPVTNAWLHLHGTGPNFKNYYTRVKNGSFKIKLPDSTYRIDGYWDESARNQIQLSQTFTVAKGRPDQHPLSLIVPKDNIMGTIKLYNGVSLDDIYLNLHSENEGRNNYSYTTKVKKGLFSLHLEDGSYVIDGYQDPELQKKVQIYVPFQVENSQCRPNPLTVTILEEHIQSAFTAHMH